MQSSTSRPNILLIMDDQHRFDFLGCAGASFVNTPNIDRLAARGVRFTQHTTNSPMCAPARVAFATGQQPARTGIVESDLYLPRSRPTIYQHFRDHEYRVGLIGKADLAKFDRYNGVRGDRPCTFMWGFTHPFECEGKIHASRAVKPLGPYTKYLNDKGLLRTFVEDYKRRGESGWLVAASHDSALDAEDVEDAFIGRRAAQWIREMDTDFPWFLTVNFVGPHDPFDPPTEYADRYRNAPMPDPIRVDDTNRPTWLRARHVGASVEDIAHTRRQYCALIELIDAQVGEVLSSLDARGLTDNTYIVFTSDHGEMLGDRGLYRKSVMYDQALRVPLIVAGPGIEGERASDALVEGIDLNPTLVELAGLPAQLELDARSFAGVLRGETDAHHDSTVSFLNNCRAVRTQQYKYIETFNDTFELYDLDADPEERRNIAEHESEIRREMNRKLRRRLRMDRWFR